MFQSLGLKNVMPNSLPEAFGQGSEVWNTDFSIAIGQHVLISAESGKGKSTLISILYGIKKSFSGSFLVNGADSKLLSAGEWSELRGQDISIVFQDLRLFPELSVRENLLLKANLLHESFDFEEAIGMCAVLGVEKYLERPAKTLSYGERQRVAIVRSLIQQAGIILMDEPFSHLDRQNTEIALELILEKTRKSGSALLITSLGQDFGWKYDRIVQL